MLDPASASPTDVAPGSNACRIDKSTSETLPVVGRLAPLSLNPFGSAAVFAMALWAVGRHDEAVQWYAAAVRSEPQQWATPAAYVKLLPDWRETERATLAEVHAAWAANPPSWR